MSEIHDFLQKFQQREVIVNSLSHSQKMKKTLFTTALLAIMLPAAISAGEMPEGYYDTANGKSDSILKGTLRQIIRDHTVMSYGSGSGSSWEVFYYADRDTTTNLCMDMYCDDWREFTTPGAVVSGCNVEHSFAKSWWGGTENDAYKDCYHLNPSNSTANSARSNYPLGNVDEPTKTAGSLKIGKRYHEALGEEHFIWEPKDEYKGDFARAYFYMATCYGHDLNGNVPDLTKYNGWRLDNKDVGSRFAMQNDNYLEFQDWEIEVLLQWHRQDPVSTKEINRANAVNDFQHNRNPFIDYPCLAEYIWGNRKGQPVNFADLKFTCDADYLSLSDEDKCGCNNEITQPTITAPRTGTKLDFGTAAVGETVTKTVSVTGELLTKDVTVTLSGTNADQFQIATTSISAAQAMAGYELNIEYQPTTLGNHAATVVISSSELAYNITLNLTGKCAFHANPASEVSTAGFTANWSDGGVESYTLDVYRYEMKGSAETEIVNETGLTIEKVKANEHLALSDNYYDEKEGLRLGSGSGTGTLTISNLDLTQGGTLVVNAKSYSKDASSLKIVVGNNTQTVTLTTSASNYTITIPATTETKIELTNTASKKRLYITNIQLKAGGTTRTKVSVDGFPTEVSGTAYQVHTAVSDEVPVYYAVTPKGGTVSEEIKVTISQTPTSNIEADDATIFARDGRIWSDQEIQIYDLLGRNVTRLNGQLSGIYIVKTANKAQKIIVK